MSKTGFIFMPFTYAIHFRVNLTLIADSFNYCTRWVDRAVDWFLSAKRRKNQTHRISKYT